MASVVTVQSVVGPQPDETLPVGENYIDVTDDQNGLDKVMLGGSKFAKNAVRV